MVEVGIAVGWLLLILFVVVRTDFPGWRRERRRERIAPLVEAFEYSDRHRPMVPLIRGLADELSVKRVNWERKGEALTVEVILVWWAPACIYRKRLDKRVVELLREGGVEDARSSWEVNDGECASAHHDEDSDRDASA
jgi:hypothetical protein